MSQAKRPLLSIGMIVKNEMRCLKKCLDALAPLRGAVPCELVIADTGSTDGTRELAAEYADVMFDFEWCDDFSAARNAVMDRCTGVWHLQVDADEYLDEDFRQLAKFLKSRYVNKYDAIYITIKNYYSKDMSEANFAWFTAARMIRMDTGLRYEGSIHESPNLIKNRCVTDTLPDVILHHDGYAFQTPEEGKRKKRRNLPLLEAELEKDPGNLRRVLQCLESSYTAEMTRKYAEMAVDIAAGASKREVATGWPMAAYRRAIISASDGNYPELPQWIEQARKQSPNMLVLELDSAWVYAKYWSDRGEYERALEELDRYEAAVRKYDSGRYNQGEFNVSHVDYATEVLRAAALMYRVLAHTKLKQWDRAAKALERIKLAGGGADKQISNYLTALLMIWQEGDLDVSYLLKKAWDELSLDEEKGAQQRREQFLAHCKVAFRRKAGPGEREVWRLFAALGEDCDLGRAGLLAGEAYPGSAGALMEQVEDWRAIPAEAIANALSIGANLPESFGRMESEAMQAIAARIAQLWKDTPEKAWETWKGSGALGLGRALWGFSLAANLTQLTDWKRHGTIELCEFFCQRAREYLEACHSPELCAEENIHLLPAMSRYAWYCAQAWKADRAKDELGCIRMLRTGLKTYPAAKDMVSFMLDAAKDGGLNRQAASRELLALAEQVKTILAQYPAGHPMAEQIKAMPAYRQVAHLIEN